MNDKHLHEDLQALRYLDALEAGDLETVAKQWDEASHHPELELALAELDSGLTATAAARWRRRRRWVFWGGATGTMVAAGVLAVLAWPRPEVPSPSSGSEEVVSDTNGAMDLSANFATWRESRQATEDAGTPFCWPLPEPKAVRVWNSVPAELLQ
jgi:hypothetical protein